MEGHLQATVGKNLRRVRRELGYSQESFGDHVGWHRTFVGAVERGERNLTLKTVERLSDQLGVHPLDLLWDQEAIGVALAPDGRTRFVPRKRPRVIESIDDGGPVAIAADGAVRPAHKTASTPRGGRSPRPKRSSS